MPRIAVTPELAQIRNSPSLDGKENIFSRRLVCLGSVFLGYALCSPKRENATQRELAMLCPFCRIDNDRVIDSRAGDDGHSIRRRRECLGCRRRYTTYERIERQLLAVVKKGGDHEPFNRDKIKRGLARACWKRPVSEEEMEAVVSAFESELYGTYESEVPSRVIGERLMELLRSLDQVAFVRFASVYREFKDVRDFFEELEPILAEANRPVA